ncbi:RelA/SpoT domain-containing protein [Ralstonia nicotianae]|uniref:(P)ppGpp synthetase n=1 Tax=Ralstonia pseudosolanacearum TaxID=1310165 RepID=A0A454TSR2_9RALS|nr:RelA/SpoT domain-containing protein [Ralstonia pseudosolanacearum]MCK4133226.1 RelA/SpoT domain-containing protein [Ralstonia pseudosolanacearum]MDK1380794.1 RelA/SpoT domain-containing protein [Ralstonia pseudosolanacearum]RAA11387.1 (p)ppGpp synthetase [Ralstonia pseudosolanacearum]RNM07329.1 (p)ppGpp synthetase [Ralstonia pseudosolanacearum]
MSFTIPNFSRKGINRAGETLIDNDSTEVDLSEALILIKHWRACHAYPVNTFQATLRSRLKKICQDALVAQRLKRVPSIARKLAHNNGMKLSRMQDIGGLRAVVKTPHQVAQLRDLYRAGNLTHELVKIDDYISSPKSSGYRSLHLVYRYKNPGAPEYNGLLIELQFRTRLQHAWATAVETIGSFINHALKASEGPDDWLNFFCTASAAFAHMEDTPRPENFATLPIKEIQQLCVAQADALDVSGRLTAYAIAANAITKDTSGGSYHLVVLNSAKRTVAIESFGRKRLDDANEAYARMEKDAMELEDLQIVLVATNSIDSLRRAYPNYFLDTRQFLNALSRIRKAVAEADDEAL